MRRLITIGAVLALASLTVVFVLLGTAGSDAPRSGDAPVTSPLPKPLTGPTTFTTGIADPVYLATDGGNEWLSRTVGSGARFILVWVDWATVSPQPPPAGTDPSDPANPAYSWSALDATVRSAAAHGLGVVLSITKAPTWAEGPGRPSWVQIGTWRPNAAAFGAFAEAVARRYSGSYNPGTGVLPRVRYFQAWSEPNAHWNLTPQWVRVQGRWVAESPTIYRGLLNAAYAAIKAVDSSDIVLTAGTAPTGQGIGGHDMRPGVFVRDLLCLQGQALTPAPCPTPAHFDILAHDPYSMNGPLQPAYWADDITLADMSKLTRILAVAQRTGRALPRIDHPIWATELAWISAPNRDGVTLIQRAHWIDEGFFELWRQGISTATWFEIVDPAAAGVFWYTGLYYSDGRRKPGFEAFRFPFLVYRAGSGWAQIWAVSPDSGIVRVQALESGRWTTVLRARAQARGVIDQTIAVSGRPVLRAVIGSDTSLGWRA